MAADLQTLYASFIIRDELPVKLHIASDERAASPV
jgi:hypothetical protein